MKLFLLTVMLTAAPLLHGGSLDSPDESTPGAAASEWNVNSRYTVESVEIAPRRDYKLSGAVREEIGHLIGEHLNVDHLDHLSRKITAELRARNVTFRVHRGVAPAHVRVTFEVERRDTDFDVSLSNLIYNSRQGWTGTGRAALTVGDNAFTLAGLSNGDDQVERYSGLRARYDRLRVPGSRLRLGFEFDTFREQYDSRTSSLGAGLYRSRTNFEPSATFVLAKPLTLTMGLSFENLQPASPLAKADSANAWVNALRFHQSWETPEANSHDLDGAYQLRAATGFLGATSLYTKHTGNLHYRLRHAHQSVEVALLAGMIRGQAPLFERFILGNNSTLRGWNKYDLDPLGGNRMAYASVTYGYHIVRVFYDTGSVWDHGQPPKERHSVGAGVTTGLGLFSKNALLVALAFPLRRGHVEPMVIAGMNF